MQDYIERMMNERDELCDKIDKLSKGVVKFGTSLPKRCTLMQSQLHAMKNYLFFLEERIHYELSLEEKTIEGV